MWLVKEEVKQLLPEDIKPYVPLSFDENKKIAIEKHENNFDEDLIKKGYEQGFNKGYEAGYNEGLSKGYEEGFSKSQREIKEKSDDFFRATQFFKNIIKELSLFKEKQIEFFLPQILKFAFKIAEKIVSTKIALDREVTFSIVKETLKSVPFNEDRIIIKLNPEDYDFIANKINELEIDKAKLQIESSPDITKGGCWIETQSQHIVSTIEQRLKEIENALNSVISQQS